MTSRPGRKLGHITATGRTVEEALMRATKAKKGFEIIAEVTKGTPENE